MKEICSKIGEEMGNRGVNRQQEEAFVAKSYKNLPGVSERATFPKLERKWASHV